LDIFHPIGLWILLWLYYKPIDSPPSFPGRHNLHIAWLNTVYNMKAILLHYNITDQLLDTKGSPTKQVRQDTILGGVSIGQLFGSCMSVCPLPTLMFAQLTDNYKVLFLADWHINNPFVGPSEMMVHQNAGNYKMYLTSKLIKSYGPIRRLNLCISLITHTCNVWHKVISHICWTNDHHFKHSVETEIGYGQEIFCTKFEVSWFKIKVRVTFWQVNICLFYSVLAHVKLTHLTPAHAFTLQCFDIQTSCLEMFLFYVCLYSSWSVIRIQIIFLNQEQKLDGFHL